MSIGIQTLIDGRIDDKEERAVLSDFGPLRSCLVEALEEGGGDVLGVLDYQYRGKLQMCVLVRGGQAYVHTDPDRGRWIAGIFVSGRLKAAQIIMALQKHFGGVVHITRLNRGE